jgi:DNA-binding IclR family transcriptional regulator
MVRSVDRALDVLVLVANEALPVPLPDITRGLDLPRTTAFSLVKTLAERGMLTYVDGKGYQLGPMVSELARAYRPPRNLIELAHRWLEQVSAKTNETAFLAVPGDAHIAFVDKVEPTQAIRYSAQIGTRRPLYCTAHGKLALALRPDAEITRYLASTPLKALTDKTITSVDALRRELARIRRQGFATSDGEFSADAYSLSAPVRAGTDGPLIAMISAVGPTARLRPRRHEIADLMLSVAGQLSAQCGGIEPMSA